MTMKLKRIVLLIAVCLQALSLAAAPRIVRPGVKSPTTFAIFIDSRSYEAAAAEVDAYRAAVERDGLGTYLLIDEWQNPESVRSEIIRMTEAQPHLEGVVFVGDIPIAMIRDGQHLTSAFKSSQDRDWKDSSVPSDRYYDDPELQFEFLRRDADEPRQPALGGQPQFGGCYSAPAVFLRPEFESVLRRFLCFQMCRAGRLPVSPHRSPCVPLCARLRAGVECVPAKAH